MSQQNQIRLNKPYFIKIQALKRGYNGYNVYVKVISVQTPQVQQNKIPIIKAVVADQTGAANAFFKGDNVKLIKKNNVIAIRNGCIRYIKNHISLEVDMFGRITPETVQIKQNTTSNISDQQITKKPRKPQFRNDFRRDQPRNDRNDRNQRYHKNDRNDKGQFRRGNQERGDRERGDRRPYNNNRPAITWTKIGGIQPGDDQLNIIAQVVSVKQLGKRLRVVLGDETGTVNAFLYQNDAIKSGQSIVLFKCEAKVVKQHIEIQFMERGRVQQARRKVQQVNNKFNVSAKEWVEA